MSTENQTATPTKRKQNRKAQVSVVQSVTTAVQVGRDNYLMKGTSDGRGVRLENKDGGIFIPYGDGGRAILEQLNTQVEAGSGRRRRRTKAEILASKAE